MIESQDKPAGLIKACREYLQQRWETIKKAPDSASNLPPAIIEAVTASINADTKSYRYVLPTQLLVKVTDPSLDCRSVQADCGLDRPFDARSVCQKVIVAFDRENQNVLGGAPEPYVNNPLRIPAILKKHRKAQRNQAEFNRLLQVLEFAQDNPALLPELFDVVLIAIRRRMEQVAIVYPVPNRVSLEQTRNILHEFLREKTGGLRLQAIAVALFRTIGSLLRLFDRVESNRINAADAATGSAADLECLDSAGRIVFAVEVKDQQLELRHVQDKLPKIREKGIRELIFLIQGRVAAKEEPAVDDLIRKQFASGQNIYLCPFDAFLEACLVLFGEAGRRVLLQNVGEELDRIKADFQHRKVWQELLSSI